MLWLLLFVPAALAHKPSDSYLRARIENGRLTGQWDLALRDLEFAVGLDANEDGEITWGELRARQQSVYAYALERLRIRAGGVVQPLGFTEFMVDRHSDGAYAVLRFAVPCPNTSPRLSIEYAAMFDLDPSHRGLLSLESGGSQHSAVFSPEQRHREFDLYARSSDHQFFPFVREGMWHIWIGYDHVLFLIALLLPSVLRRESTAWRGVERFQLAFWNVCKIVTAFTAAHSITLSVAALGLVQLPARLVESAIAASVVVAAVNNLRPFVRCQSWMVAFGFGLIHGFGFANVLADLGLAPATLARTLIAFNLGVELGQVAIVGVALPLAFVLRSSWFYQALVVRGASAGISVLALAWMGERLLDRRWLAF
jgi:hypothetical protein